MLFDGFQSFPADFAGHVCSLIASSISHRRVNIYRKHTHPGLCYILREGILTIHSCGHQPNCVYSDTILLCAFLCVFSGSNILILCAAVFILLIHVLGGFRSCEQPQIQELYKLSFAFLD